MMIQIIIIHKMNERLMRYVVKYLRVSTEKQDTARQDMQLDKIGIRLIKNI
ncbi:hypothetical protein [Clostridium beijerinckii]|uniref:hypothetical protein n=1 Tax=Clostridium beijerinckii TaxID=1520 RepID=UPI001D9DB0D1|nr:hypothetical protein [Clostridium beijerinckii]